MTDDAGDGVPQYHFKIDDDLMIALGRLAYGASYLEGVVGIMYLRLLTQDLELGRRVIADATMQWLIDHSRALIQYRFSEGGDRDALENWLRQVDSVRSKRNRVLHSDWYVAMTELEIRHGLMKASVKGKSFKVTMDLVTPSDLHSVAVELEQVGLDGVHLMSLVSDVMGQLTY
jgi:hypothetical protein